MTSNINTQLALKPVNLNYDLFTGWNLVSIPLTLDNDTPSGVFTSISGNYGDVFTYAACDSDDHWKLFNPNLPSYANDLTDISLSHGYWINMSSTDILSLTGTHPMETTIPLCKGWNLVGYPSVVSRPVATALSSIDGLYSLVRQYKASDTEDPWKVYNPSAPPQLSDLNNLEPGYGYWIYITEESALLTIPGR
jgi:hypothetical protein